MQARRMLVVLSALIWAGFVGTAQAGTIVWGNNASGGNPLLEAFDFDTGNVVTQFVAPHPDAVSGNGRGIAVVGTTIYYTLAGSGKVYITDANTHADLGVAFDSGLGGIATVAWDGTALWIDAYDGTDNAYRYTPTGTLLQTVPGFGNFRDGFEVTGTNLIANRGDATGPYDLYDLNGVLVQSNFITPNFSPTGITFDGTFYYVSDIFNNKIVKYDGSGNFVEERVLGGPQPPEFGRLLEDLSSLGNIPSNPPPGEEQPPGNPEIPEPATLILVGFGMIGLGLRRKRL